MASPYLGTSALNLLLSAALGLHVYRRNPRGRTNRLFARIMAGEALWSAARRRD